MKTSTTARDLLVALGIGQFNATMVIQSMFIAPATTDPKSPPVMILVKAIQKRMKSLGYQVPGNGYLDLATANAITSVAGTGWQNRAWADTVKAVLVAPAAHRERVFAPAPVSGFLPSLPDVPGGMFTYAAAGAAAYYFWTKRR